MPEQHEIYFQHAQEYERLIIREDHHNNLSSAIQERCQLDNRIVADIGTGTGRFIRMLKPHVRFILGLDISAPMLHIAKNHLEEHEGENWYLSVADNAHLPLAPDSVDLAVAGWSFGHATVWFEDRWQEEISRFLAEMLRILQPGGIAMIFETMGTGTDAPGPPTETLKSYYAYLQGELGFEQELLETDYQFSSLDEAEELSRFFFGDELGDKVVKNNWVMLPEWTGLWWRKK